MAEASSPSAATAASPPRRRSSLRRIQTAREKWEAHRARQKLMAAKAKEQQEEEEEQKRDDDPAQEAAAAPPSVAAEETPNATSASDGPPGAPAFDRRANILRAKKKGDGAPKSKPAVTKEDKGPPPNPFANISLTSSTSASKPTFSFATGGASSAPAPSFSFAAAGSTGISFGQAAESKGSAAFPPLAASAPKPVGLATAGEGKEKAKGSASSSSGGGGFPPMSAAAPKPFSSTTKSDEGGSASSSGGGGGYPPLSTAAPKPFSASSKDNTAAAPKSTASPFANLSLGGSSTTSSAPFGFEPTATAANTGAGVVRSSKNIFGGTGAFGGGDAALGEKNASDGTGGTNIFGSSSAFCGGAAFGGGNSGASTGFSFGTKGTTPSPFGAAPAGGASPSPFGAPAAGTGSSPFGGFGKPSVNAPTPVASTQDGQSDKGEIDYKARLTEFYKEHNPDKLPAVDANLAKYKGKEDEMFRKLYQRYGLDANGKKVEDPFLAPGGTGPRVYMDLSMGGTPMGRIVMQLYADKTPITAENFRGLCTGYTTEANGKRRELQKTYATNHFHRIVPGMCFQGGDITCGNGTGGRSIYPANDPRYKTDGWGKFADETPFMKHSKRGLLSMANAGANQNSSQFFITMKELPYLNGKHVIFGEVLEPSEDGDDGRGDGMKVLDRIMQTVEVNPKNHRPKEECRVVIDACGEFT